MTTSRPMTDETKAPAKLPETLPIGTRYGGSHGGGVAVSELHREGSIYRGKFQKDDGSPCPGDRCGSVFIDWTSVAALSSPPSPAEGEAWVPKVGDAVSWDMGGADGERATGEIVRVQAGHIRVRRTSSSLGFGGHANFDNPSPSLRLIRRATPPEGKEADLWDCLACGAKCGDHPDHCGICGTVRGHKKMRGADPYTTRPHGMNEEQVAAAMTALTTPVSPPAMPVPNAHDLRVAAMKEQLRADLDRPLPKRGKWDWDVDDSDELRVT